MLNTAQVVQDAQAAFSAAFNQGKEGTSTKYQMFTMDTPFDGQVLTLGWLGEFEDLREWVGDRVLTDINAYGYTVAPKKFERTKSIAVSDLNDTLIATTAQIMRGIGEAAARHPQKLVVDLLKNGESGLCYDGEAFFSDAHPVVDASGADSTQSNLIAGTGTGWYLLRGDANGETSVLKPFVFGARTGEDYQFKTHGGDNSTLEFMKGEMAFGVNARVAAAYGLYQFALKSNAALTADNLEAAISAMAAITGDNGVAIENAPNMIVVPESLRSAAEKILNTTKNGDNIHYKRLEIVVLKGL